MNRKDKAPDAVLDRAIEKIRGDLPHTTQVEQAADRVWQALSGQHAANSVEPAEPARPEPVEGSEGGTIRDCTGFQALIPFYLSHSLTRARALLLEDHLQECLVCRRALQEARWESENQAWRPSPPPAAPSRRGSRVVTWAMAAAIILAAGVGAFLVYQNLPGLETGALAEVRETEGGLFHVMVEVSQALVSGQPIKAWEAIRTAKGAGALLRLSDGSMIEMRERSELSLSRSPRGTTIHLARGSVIVEAAQQGSGNLFLESGDCVVSVTGTVFSVNRGTKGSRVSVIEGEVQVEYGTERDLLGPGAQISTHVSMGRIPVEEEIAWSRDLDRHLAVLRELQRLGQELDETVPRPPLRYSTRLLDLVPEGTVIFTAIPNLGETIGEAHRLFMEGVEKNPVLSEWWSEIENAEEIEMAMSQVIEKVRLFGDHLGEEIVLAVALGRTGQLPAPVLLAELTHPDDFPAVVEELVREIGGEVGGTPILRVVDNPWTVTASAPEAFEVVDLWIHGNLLVGAPGPALLRDMAGLLEGRRVSGFVGTPFHRRLAAAYEEGSGWLLGVDLKPLLGLATAGIPGGPAATPEVTGALEASGLTDIEHLVLERKEVEGVTHNRARLTFDQPRRGVASWLATPSPMGTLDFISADANLVTAFAVKDPATLVEELFDMLESANPGLRRELDRFQQEQGLDIVEDFAAPLGGEFALALDGPILPVPAFKVAVEVYDPPRFQRSLEWMVSRIGQALLGTGAGRLSLERREQSGRTVYTLKLDQPALSLEYIYVDGYLVAAPNWTLIQRALQRREAGHVLRNSARFKALLPRDREANFSALVYQDMGFVLAPLARIMSQTAPGLTPEGRETLGSLAAESSATLVYAYGEEDQILIAAASRGGLFGSDLGALASLGSTLGIQRLLTDSWLGSRYHTPHRLPDIAGGEEAPGGP